MASENGYLIRPFSDLYDELWMLLKGTVIEYPKQRFLQGNHNLKSEVLRDFSSSNIYANIEIDLVELSDQLQIDNLQLSDIRLSIYTYSRENNLGSIVYSSLLSDLDNGNLRLLLSGVERPESDPLLAILNGFDINVVLTLDKHRESSELKLSPRLQHSILSKAVFSFGPEKVSRNTFQINKLTNEIRENEGIPESNVYYAKFMESPLISEQLSDCVIFYVDSNVLSRLEVSKNSDIGKLYVADIGVELLSGLVLKSSNELNRYYSDHSAAPLFEDIKKTVLGKLVKSIHKKGQSKKQKISQDELIEEMINRPERTLARIASMYSVQKRMLDGFEVGDDK